MLCLEADTKLKRISFRWDVCVQPRIENQLQNKHVESSIVPCLDEGSNPSDSTLIFPNRKYNNYLRFFYVRIFTPFVQIQKTQYFTGFFYFKAPILGARKFLQFLSDEYNY